MLPHRNTIHAEPLRQPGLAAISLIAVCLLCAGSPSPAGDLNPPAGPITPTQRTPINATTTPGDADSLFRIDRPGSYYLTGNITGALNKHGIEIAASDVTIDLCGFLVESTPAMGFVDGITTAVADLTGIRIHGGTVKGWGDEGIDLGTMAARGSTIIDIRVSGCGSTGMRVGPGSLVRGCIADANDGIGFLASTSCTFTDCRAFSNAGRGISAITGAVLTACTAESNEGEGISVGSGSTVNACAANDNVGGGITTGGGSSHFQGCSALSNDSFGFNVSGGCTLSGCIAAGNTGVGIATGSGCTIIGCTATSNMQEGITSSSSTIANCTTRLNTLDGIRVSSGCTVGGNTCTSNGNSGDGAGIHATGGDNRIEGNNCTGSDRGIDVDLGGNIIARNVCSGNTTNWDISAANVCLVVTATTSAAFSGNSGGVAPGSTDPNANFTY